MTGSRIERCEDPPSWNAFVRSQAGWTHFHLYEWKHAVEEVFGHECIYLAQLSGDGALEGVLPLVRVKSKLFGHFLVSMPFVNYGGPLGLPEAVQNLADHAVELARNNNADLLELRSPRDIGLSLPVSHRKVTVILDLPAHDPNLLWRQFKAKLRTKVRRAAKEGIQVRFGTDQIEPFYSVFARNMRDLGTPALPRKWFDQIARVFEDAVWCACAYLDGKPVASGYGLRWGVEYEMTWGAALWEYNRIRPNLVLYWNYMQRAIDVGVTRFNFGRCTPGGGTHQFKLQWGSREETLWWYQHQGREGTAGTPSPDDARYALGPRIWKRLPVRLATAVGPSIVRYIP
jgi:FemAB-related protein (PEP-CTERM system-associated)